MLWKNTKLKRELHKVTTKEVTDILLFGSTVRGKVSPNDLDVLVLFADKVDKKVEYTIRKVLESYSAVGA